MEKPSSIRLIRSSKWEVPVSRSLEVCRGDSEDSFEAEVSVLKIADMFLFIKIYYDFSVFLSPFITTIFAYGGRGSLLLWPPNLEIKSSTFHFCRGMFLNVFHFIVLSSQLTCYVTCSHCIEYNTAVTTVTRDTQQLSISYCNYNTVHTFI